jgi:L-alanine-DL-glutamate epimerase-like enolase superfamily enzyme
LTAKSNLRIAAGEHSTTRWEFIDLMDRARIQVVQPWMTTVGGLSEAKRVVDLALRRGVIVCPGNWSTQVLGSASVHFAAASPISPIIEFPPAAVHWSPLRKAIEEVGMPLIDGAIRLPTKPGIGIDLSNHLIDHFRVA